MPGLARASMRPPQFAGESELAHPQPGVIQLASMRPPQFAGESAFCQLVVLLNDIRLQ